MKAKYLLLLTLIFLSAIVSAEFTINPDPFVISANHGTTVSGIINVTSASNLSSITIQGTDITFIPSSFSLDAGKTQQVSFSINIPKQTAPGLLIKTYTVKNETGTASKNGEIKVNVNSTPSLSLSFAPDKPSQLTKSSKNTTLVVTNDGNVPLLNIDLSYDTSTLKDKADRVVILSFSKDNFALEPGKSENVNVTANIPSNLDLGDYTTSIKATTTVESSIGLTVKNTFCDSGRVGSDLKIVRIDSTIKNRDADDDFEWKPGDEIDLEVRVRNNGADEEEITVQIALYDVTNKQFVDIDDDEENQDIADGESEDILFNIEIPTDIEDEPHRLYVKAFIEGDEDVQCTDFIENVNGDFKSIDIEKKSHDVKMGNIIIPETVACGDVLDISARISNIGDQDEDRVVLTVGNRQLNIDKTSLPVSLDPGDDRTVQLSILIPKDEEDGKYTLELSALYNYDDDDDVYKSESDVEKRDIELVDCKPKNIGSAAISAELTSDAKAGEQMIVKANIVNTGDETATYILSAEGYEDWASLSKIEPQTITIPKGSSASALIYLNINSAVSDEKEFTIKTTSDGNTESQKVSVVIENAGSRITGAAVAASFRNNWFIWLIVLINIILIVLIIIAARRLV